MVEMRDFYRRPKMVRLPQAGPVSDAAITPILETALETVRRQRWGMSDDEGNVVFVDQWLDEDGNPAPPPPDPPSPPPPAPDWWLASDDAWREFAWRFGPLTG